MTASHGVSPTEATGLVEFWGLDMMFAHSPRSRLEAFRIGALQKKMHESSTNISRPTVLKGLVRTLFVLA